MPLTGDGYFAGEYPGGTTTVEGAPVSAAVLVYQRDSGQLIAQTESSQSGEWIVTGVDLSKAHDIVGRKEGFNDVIVSNVMPTSMVDITYTGDITINETFTGALGYLDLVGGIPPYAASVVDPLPAGIFPVVNGRQLIIDGTTTDDDVFNSIVRITSSNGATKDVPVNLVVGFKAPANLEAETLEDAGAFSVVLTWGVTNTTQEVLVFKSTTPFNLESMPAPIATLTGNAVSYTDDDVIENDEFYYMAASVCEGFTLHSDEVREVVNVGDPHWDKVVSLLHFDGDLVDEAGLMMWSSQNTGYSSGLFNECVTFSRTSSRSKVFTNSQYLELGLLDFTIEFFVKVDTAFNSALFDMRPSMGSHNEVMIESDRGNLYLWMSDGYRLGPYGSAIPNNSFIHIALVRDSGTFKLFAGGVLLGSVLREANLYSQYVQLGANMNTSISNPDYDLTGAIDELRITKGVARYTANFTPPIEPFPNM